MASISDVAPSSPIKLDKYGINEDIWQITLDHIEPNTGRLLQKLVKPLSEAGSSTHAFDKRHVLYSKLRPYLNKVLLPDAIGVGTTELVPMLPNPERLDRNYLAHYLKSKNFVSWISSQTAGAKMPRVSMKVFWNHKIPLPPIKEQKRIAAILDKADAIRRKRQQAIGLTDQLLRSVFLEMFGDPVTNPKGIKIASMTDVFDIKTGKLNSNAAVEGGEYPFFTCAKQAFEIDTYAFDQEALLLAGNNAQAIYDVKHFVGKFNAYQRTYVLTLKDESWSYPFYQFALEYQLENLKRFSKGSNTKYITMEIMGRTMLPLPHPNEQLEFVRRVETARSLTRTHKKHKELTEVNFQSLTQQAFNGQLSKPTQIS